jgi:type IV pilus assembly protein PilB
MPTPRLRLGQLLVDARLISAAALDEVLAAQRADGRRLGTLLVERGLINETQLTQILSHQLSVPWVSLLHIEFSRQLLNLVPREVADRYCLVPIYVRHVRNQGETLYVAMDDPSNEEGLKACRDHSGLPVRSMIAPPADIRSAIRVYYGVDSGAARPEPQSITQPAPPHPTPSAREPETKREPALVPAKPEPAPAEVEAKPAPVEAKPVETAPEPAPPKADEAVPAPAVEEAAQPQSRPRPDSVEGPEIEAVEIPVDLTKADRLRGILEPPHTPPPPSSPPVDDIPRPRGRAPRMVSLTLLDGTTINLPAKRRQRRPPPGEEIAPAATAAVSPSSPPGGSEPPTGVDSITGLTARDLVLALRVVANGADASEVLGENLRWEALFSALLSLMLKKHLIADWEFIDELKKQL